MEPDVGPVLKNRNLNKRSQPHDEVVLKTDSLFKHYEANEDPIILKDNPLFQKDYGETGSVRHCPFLVPKQLVDDVLQSLPGEFEKHPWIAKTIHACRYKYCYPNMAQLIGKLVKSCKQRARESRIDKRFARPPLQNSSEHIRGPKDATRKDLVPELHPSGGYENILQLSMCSLDHFSLTQQQVRMLKESTESKLTSWRTMPTYQLH